MRKPKKLTPSRVVSQQQFADRVIERTIRLLNLKPDEPHQHSVNPRFKHRK